MTGGRASLIWLVVLATAVGVFAGVWLVPHLGRVADQTETLEQLEAEGQKLSTRVQDLTRELSNLLATPTKPEPKPNEARGPRKQVVSRAETARRLQDVRLLAETQEKLKDARLTVDELKAKIESLSASIKQLQKESRRLSEDNDDLRSRLDRSSRVVEAVQSELKGNSERLVKLETRNRQLREDKKKLERAGLRMVKLVRDLENLQRRRESLLTNIVHRYRDVADEYRNVAIRLNNPEQYGPTQGIDLSRIQNALGLADQDLEQLRGMNTRAAEIQRELSK